MIIRLETQKTTQKAYLLVGGGWIPKSVLRADNLKFPYFEIKDWYLKSTQLKCNDGDTQAQDTITGLNFLAVEVQDLPEKIKRAWKKAHKCEEQEQPAPLQVLMLDLDLY